MLVALACSGLARAQSDPSLNDVEEVVVLADDLGASLQRSAQAVQVVDTRDEQLESADLGEVLSRVSGVSVRRTGGLGSSQRFSLNGLTDNQVRFFLDGVPLDLAGYPFGMSNVPLAFVDRVEIYRGVVPIRFGADALGGAVNLAEDPHGAGTRASASVQVGSFDTGRLSGGLTHQGRRTGLFVRAGGFYDGTRNDFPVWVEVPDSAGRPVETRAHRFHDAYAAGGGHVEVGVAERPWADRLSFRAFATGLEQEIQNNPSMTVPYGEVVTDRQTGGAMLRYEVGGGGPNGFALVAGATRTRSDFVDVGECIYDWFGQCVRPRQDQGEIDEGEPLDQTLHESAAYARLHGRLALGRAVTMSASLSPTYIDRSGVDHLAREGFSSSVTANRTLLTTVGGVEMQSDLADDRLQSLAFGKVYLQSARSVDPVFGLLERALDRDTHRFGGGGALRWRLGEASYTKLSYEYATRLPEADEVFGDAVLVNENLGIRPEISHNVNVEVTAEDLPTRIGVFRGTLVAFLRETDDLIVTLDAYGQRFRNENVFAARSVGTEVALGYSAPGQWLDLSGNGTYLDFRNRTDQGPFAPFLGDRIPNRPFFFVNGTAQLQTTDAIVPGDVLGLRWHTRYVAGFYEFWESAGTADSKRSIPAQLTHAASVTLSVASTRGRITLAGEVDNLTDERVYDVFGAQRPGRAFFFKATVEQ